MSKADDRPVDHIARLWARVARSMGQDVRVLEPGEYGGVGSFANDALLTDQDLHWQRFYLDGGAIVIVPYDPVLDEVVGRRVRVERDRDGVLQVHAIRVSDSPRARPDDVGLQKIRAVVHLDVPPLSRDQKPTLRVAAADDAPTEIIEMARMHEQHLEEADDASTEIIEADQMHELLMDADDASTEIIEADQMRTLSVRIDPAHRGDETRELRVDPELLQRLYSSQPNRERQYPEPLDPGGLFELGFELESELKEPTRAEDPDKTWDVLIDPEVLARLKSKS